MSGPVQLQTNGQIGSAFMSGINAVVVPGSASPGAVYVQGSNKTGAAQMPGSGQTASIHIQGSGLVSSVQSTVKSPSGATIQHLGLPSLSRGEIHSLLLSMHRTIADLCSSFIVEYESTSPGNLSLSFLELAAYLTGSVGV